MASWSVYDAPTPNGSLVPRLLVRYRESGKVPYNKFVECASIEARPIRFAEVVLFYIARWGHDIA